MKTSARIAALALISGALLVPAAMAAEPAASQFYRFVGHWKGAGELTEAGKAPVAVSLRLSCRKAASGWAVSCEFAGRNAKMTMTEVDLFGVDGVTGQGHWYAITNDGDAHDHLTKWVDARTMEASHAWTDQGKQMEEHITVTLPRKNDFEFHSVVSADGKQVNEFSGKLKR